MGQFVTIQGSGESVQWSFYEEKIEQVEALEGCYAIATDVIAKTWMQQSREQHEPANNAEE